MKKILALLLAVLMVAALCACGSKSEAPAAEAAAPAAEAAAPAADAAAPAGEVTWADYQEYLIEKAGSNAPDLEEFKSQVYAINSWEELDQTVSPWDQMFTTIGLSTWEEFQQGIVKEPAVMGGPDPAASGEASGEATEEPAEEAAAEGDASGEPSGDPMPANGEIEITVNGVTGVATFEETDNGDQATKGLSVTWNGETYTGAIDKGVYTADDAAAQPIFDALQAARSAAGTGEPTGEPQA